MSARDTSHIEVIAEALGCKSFSIDDSDGTVTFSWTDEPDCPCCKNTMEETPYFREEKHLGEYDWIHEDATHVCLDCGSMAMPDGEIVWE